MKRIGIVFSSIVFGIFCQIFLKGIQKRAIERGLGWYNPATGKFEWTDEDIQYALYGKVNEFVMPPEFTENPTNKESNIYKINNEKEPEQ